MKPMLFVASFLATASARAQIHFDLKLPRLQYIAHEPIITKPAITNLAGREPEESKVEFDRVNQLHILPCSAPRNWTYSQIGLNGEILARLTFIESKARPRLQQAGNGAVMVFGGTIEAFVAESARTAIPKLSARPAEMPKED